ncbi:MAG: hypothetical protein F6K04_21710 [Leptolyngbya sp. SIO4C5]|nr:hypothetical protein [Leptolyngbya sp. SIO4C5]
MSSQSYTPPVDQLLEYQECLEKQASDWPNYPAEFGLTSEHVPDLIRMAMDEALWDSEEKLQCWAPWHALRSLAQLQAGEAAAALVPLFDFEDDWLPPELIAAFSMLGEPAFESLTSYIAADREADDEIGVITAVEALGELAKKSVQLRTPIVEFMQTQLEQFQSQSAGLNGILVQELVELQVTAAAPLIEQVYQQGPVDQLFAGSWPRIQIALGLAQESDFSEEELKPQLPEGMEEFMEALEQFEAFEQARDKLIDSELSEAAEMDTIARGWTLAENPRPMLSDFAQMKQDTSSKKKTNKSKNKKGFGGAQSEKSKKDKKK